MAIASSVLPSKCCCCSLRAGSIVVGSFSLVISLTFLGLCATASSLMNQRNCRYKSDGDNNWSNVCETPPETYKMVANIMALLSILNAIEVLMCMGLIWGASKRILSWVTAWLITSSCWILLHTATATAFLFATSEAGWIVLVSVLGILVLGMALLSMLTVVSFREELKSSLPHSFNPRASAPLPDSLQQQEISQLPRQHGFVAPPGYQNVL